MNYNNVVNITKEETSLIKNIVFDMGGVLIDFNPSFSLKKVFKNENDETLLLKEFFAGPDWPKLDRGTMTVEQALDRICERIPKRLHSPLHRLMENWADEMPPIEEMRPLVFELKEKGYGIYLLSNAPLNFFMYRHKIPGIEHFDGEIVSSDWLCVKPEHRIYEILFEQFSLLPEECYFIDDIKANIEGAAAVGMKGHCFDHGNVTFLRKAMTEAGIL